MGLASLLSLTAASARTTRTYNNKILSNNLAESATSKAIDLLTQAMNPLSPETYRPDLLTMTEVELAAFVENELMAGVNGPDGQRSVSLRVPNDGSFRLLAMDRVPGQTKQFTLRGEGIFRDPALNRPTRSVIEIDTELMFDLDRYGAVLMSDMPNLGTVRGGGQAKALDGNVLIHRTAGVVAVMGGVLTNGDLLDFRGEPLDLATAEEGLHTIHPSLVQQGLYGKRDEIPDYTLAGERDQLFDFDRFAEVASQGSGQVFNSLQDFVQAQNTEGVLEGLIVVNVNPADHLRTVKGKPRLSDLVLLAPGQAPGTGEAIPSPPIHINGSLVVRIAPSFTFKGVDYRTPPTFRVTFATPVSINPAPSGEVETYLEAIRAYDRAVRTGSEEEVPVPDAPSGYQSPFASASFGGVRPWEVDLATRGYENFENGDDLPAIAISMGIAEFTDAVNCSGFIYSAGMVAIDNFREAYQYVEGAILAGGGIYLANKGVQGALIVAYGEETMDRLATSGTKMRTPVILEWRQAE